MKFMRHCVRALSSIADTDGRLTKPKEAETVRSVEKNCSKAIVICCLVTMCDPFT